MPGAAQSLTYPELTGALRVGPEGAGAEPGPAAYNKGGDLPTVTDANVVLGYLPSEVRLGGDMEIRKDLARKSDQAGCRCTGHFGARRCGHHRYRE